MQLFTKLFLSLRCIPSINILRFAPFSPMIDKNFFSFWALLLSFEVEGVEGVLTCGVVGLWGCMVARLNVTHTNAVFWLNSGSGSLQICDGNAFTNLIFPFMTIRFATHQTVFEDVTRHDYRCALNWGRHKQNAYHPSTHPLFSSFLTYESRHLVWSLLHPLLS